MPWQAEGICHAYAHIAQCIMCRSRLEDGLQICTSVVEGYCGRYNPCILYGSNEAAVSSTISGQGAGGVCVCEDSMRNIQPYTSCVPCNDSDCFFCSSVCPGKESLDQPELLELARVVIWYSSDLDGTLSVSYPEKERL